MNLFKALILGIVEGITEFLPISSTAHLIIASKLLNISQTEFQKFFEVFIQSGAILAVVFIYIQYILKNPKIIKSVLISFIPTAIVGFLLHKVIKNIFFESFYLIIGSLFSVGLLFIVFEYLVKNKRIVLKKSIIQLTIFDAVVIGMVQSLSVVPGVSRAGAVMLGMMAFGYKREESAVYSFLLAVPTIFAAGAFDLYQSRKIIFSSLDNIWILIFGFWISFIFAYISIKWLINYLKKNSLVVFGIYRIIISLLLFML
ncbi:undecaprenyl-diphosphatase [Candidatus Roizmanbacteria bacterium CG_4_10_14_0_2_um_filter_36_35]|uniref:Undecaprenyl-diphosphatase n=4 Tax=Candidatus Roizmaniibacteriota TaxID=1752723 RepID=A0A2M7BXL4_9BACT|nr:MAG: undecaprenyl-diphosphatase [Candidatus Roizmanbacteria bacterium CG11_big_fil_rev_8_21_14_0_20_35_14]PIV11308.1 MAG: undecaprenyl-diphosphatase [Candidatus Roizmanbacteria bacterium CG03_land_8_20_14_0_80_35_26]PIZ68978.1 MAG: undecaprenyl-diphosphatase [Candidatus Roizmanbacteria bacterium CG_4_10_14_0_2_um_filter_36_35]PJC32366.1 MAG: undecaprenyl-diphosphatase [Candidatus Roizmanbacteria bacterium CG_4_9_14_0_2_um_filter_36_12]PJC80326.1 MAG: undecaprenyl-diphosphatase [Candidatus Ro